MRGLFQLLLQSLPCDSAGNVTVVWAVCSRHFISLRCIFVCPSSIAKSWCELYHYVKRHEVNFVRIARKLVGESTLFQQAVFHLWFAWGDALVGAKFVTHTDHAINTFAASASAWLILGATLNNACGRRTPWYANRVLKHDYMQNSKCWVPNFWRYWHGWWLAHNCRFAFDSALAAVTLSRLKKDEKKPNRGSTAKNRNTKKST